MTLESKCVSLDTAHKLKEVGFPQGTEHWYSAWSDHPAAENSHCHELHWELHGEDDGAIAPRVAAPDSAEIGEQLPDTIGMKEDVLGFYCIKLGHNLWWATYGRECNYVSIDKASTEAEARASAYIYLKEHKLI